LVERDGEEVNVGKLFFEEYVSHFHGVTNEHIHIAGFSAGSQVLQINTKMKR
jgi:hypothetical protein